ncbi:tetratricopeptide repeat protein [Mucilaginibacter sp. OK283]|uniref:tetratricopeptide repeat protein n=1 Tax=Mucilaginibacter sp. OK283 TaxID=1881049 RepID=UPI0008C7722F|nr:tetratricopeptide repeat protein [Mucilaginibacter sp. OK283]SEP42179.1 Tetratricopeptide repeat-containing protein [Mucilaginibacter sp. OK283]
MKTYHKFLLFILFIAYAPVAFGQTKDDAKALVKEGIALHNAGKYDEAIAKYNEALKIDPDYSSAYYELAYTLFSTGKGNDAIAYLEKTLKLDPKLAGAYDMLGSIYDDDKQPDKAIEYYKKGIEANPKYQRLYYNLSVAYLRQKKYAESENYAVEAIKLDPKHASSQRAYAMATFNENKRGVSLLAWCSFLLLEPQTKRSAEAYRYVQYIINYGVKQTGEKNVTINISTDDLNGANLLMPITVVNATSGKKDLSKTDSLTLQLKGLFGIADTFDDKKGDPFYKNFLGDYFKKLSETDNMPALARLISVGANQEENLQWFKDNNAKLSALDAWVTATKREF